MMLKPATVFRERAGPFGDGLFDDYVSVRWLQASCASVRAERVRGVREIAAIARQDPACAAFFQEYGANLGMAIAEWIGRFAARRHKLNPRPAALPQDRCGRVGRYAAAPPIPIWVRRLNRVPAIQV